MQTVDHFWGKCEGVAHSYRLDHHVYPSTRGLKKIASVEERRIAVVGIEVPAEYTVPCAIRPVNPPDELIFITWVGNSDQELAAWIAGGRNILLHHLSR